MGMQAVGGASGTQISPKDSGCGMAPPVATPPVETPKQESPKAGGPVDQSQAGKGAIAGATGGGPAVDALGGAAQLAALQDVMTQLVALVQQLTTLLANQAGSVGGGPVNQGNPKQGGAVGGAGGNPKQGGPVDQADPKGGPDFGELPPGVVAGASGDIPELPTDSGTDGGKTDGPPAPPTGGGADQLPKPPKAAGPSKAKIAAQKKVDADTAKLKKATDDIAKFEADRKADKDKIALLTSEIAAEKKSVGPKTSDTAEQKVKNAVHDMNATIAQLQRHLSGLTAGIDYQSKSITQLKATLAHDQTALAAVSK